MRTYSSTAVRRRWRTRKASDASAATAPVRSHAVAVARASRPTINAAASHGTMLPAGMRNGLPSAPTSRRRSRPAPTQQARYTSRIATSATTASFTYVPVSAIAHTMTAWTAIATCGVRCAAWTRGGGQGEQRAWRGQHGRRHEPKRREDHRDQDEPGARGAGEALRGSGERRLRG